MLTIGIVAAVLLSTPPSGARVQELTYAWWITARFEPKDERIEGISVKDLSENWLRASLLQASGLPPKARERGETLKDHGFELVVEADLDGDGRRERAVGGVFETDSSETGRFLLILGRGSKKEPWRKRALFTKRGEPGFSAIALREGRLEWVTCFECDTECEVVRRAGRFRLQCHSCCEGS
jgi:hypothetical protein